jgi:ankyrin repeat protein
MMSTANGSSNIKDFIVAAASGRLETVVACLDAGVPADSVGDEGVTALYVAAAGAHVQVLQALLDRGANPNCIVEPFTAHSSGGARVQSGARTALNQAVTSACPEAIQLLLDRGANPRIIDDQGYNAAHNLLDSWAQFDDLPESEDIAAQLLTHLLDTGVRVNQVTYVNQVNQVNDVNSSNYRKPDGSSLLRIAIGQQAPVRLIEVLLDRGAIVDQVDKEGATALHHAVLMDHADAVRLLLQRGADVNATLANGRNVFMLSPTLEIAHMLLDAGAEINAQDIEGRCALAFLLDRIASRSVTPLIGFLIEAGADMDLKDFAGRNSPRDYIEKNNLSGVSAFQASLRARQAMRNTHAGIKQLP